MEGLHHLNPLVSVGEGGDGGGGGGEEDLVEKGLDLEDLAGGWEGLGEWSLDEEAAMAMVEGSVLT